MTDSVTSFLLNKLKVSVVAVLAVIVLSSAVSASTTITPDLVAGVTLPDTASWTQNFQEASDKNGPAYANAFAFTNLLGYAVGKSTIGIEAGATISAGFTNMKNFQHSSNGIYNGTVPGIGPTACFHFGVGFGKGFDFIGKFMSYSQDVYAIPIPKNRYFNLKELSETAIGGRVRYNAVEEKTIIPFLLNFGGVTFSAGGDFMRGIISANGQYKKEMGSQTVTYGGTDYTVKPKGDGKYDMKTSWYQLSTTFQTVAYFDIMYLFSFYTGLGATLGYGWFQFNFDADVQVTDENTTAPLLSTFTGTNNLGNVKFESKNSYNPDLFIPTYIVGLELNISLLKIVFETQVNLMNRADVSASLGLRLQF